MVEPSLAVEGVQVIAIGARDSERAAAFAEANNIPFSGSYDDILSNPDIELIYLALPPIVHAQLSVRALQAGKHVLCEKPLSANGAGAKEIAEAAAASGRRAFVGFHYRLHGFTQSLIGAIQSGVLGSIQKVEINFSIPHFVVQPGNIRLNGDLAGGSFMDVGCYAIDLIRAAWGEPVVKSASSILYDGDSRIDMQTDGVLELDGNLPVQIRSSFIGDDKGEMSLRVVGADATLDATSVIVPQWGATLKVTDTNGDVLLEDQAKEGENSYVRQLEHLVRVLNSGEPSILDAAQAVRTMQIVDEIYLAAGLQPR
jgi:predicted dehydrogenase